MDERFWVDLDSMRRAIERATSSTNMATLVSAAALDSRSRNPRRKN